MIFLAGVNTRSGYPSLSCSDEKHEFSTMTPATKFVSSAKTSMTTRELVRPTTLTKHSTLSKTIMTGKTTKTKFVQPTTLATHSTRSNTTMTAVNEKSKDKSIIEKYFPIVVAGAIVVVFLIVLVIIMVYIKTNKSNNNGLGEWISCEGRHGTNGNPMTGSENANVTTDNQEFGVEYAEINMHLLAPKPQKQDNESDNEAAPLVYADLAFHDNNDATQISPKSQGSQFSPADDKESKAQFYEDDIAAMYAKPMKKTKKMKHPMV